MTRSPLAGLALLPAMLMAQAVHANDSTAVLGSGGLQLATTEDISMDQEDLFISPSAVKVDYVFTNKTDKDLESVVAFPMPDIRNLGEEDVSIPDQQSDNFMGFKVEQDGAPISVELQQRAFAAGLDVTDDIKAAGVPLLVFGDKTQAAIDKLPAETVKDWLARGIIEPWTGNEGSKLSYLPSWTLKSTYWWRTIFPAGKSVKVHHDYKPSVGGTVDMTFIRDGKPAENYEAYKKQYCIDDAFMKTAAKLQADAKKNRYWMEKWLSYILTTGNNWHGPIGTFHLTVDKENPESFVSFCGEGVKKTGPTTFEMTQKDFYPQQDLNVLIVFPQDVQQ